MSDIHRTPAAAPAEAQAAEVEVHTPLAPVGRTLAVLVPVLAHPFVRSHCTVQVAPRNTASVAAVVVVELVMMWLEHRRWDCMRMNHWLAAVVAAAGSMKPCADVENMLAHGAMIQDVGIAPNLAKVLEYACHSQV